MNLLRDVALQDRHRLVTLFAGHRHLRAGVDSVLQGYCGTAVANAGGEYLAAQLAIGPITFFGGDAGHPSARRMIANLSGLSVIVVPDDAWRESVFREHGDRVKTQSRLPFSSEELKLPHLLSLASRVPDGYRIERIDAALAERIGDEVDPDLILPEAFTSPTDFFQRGIGFCALRGDRIVCGATSGLVSDGSIEIQINTHADHRGLGLATAIGAALAAHCLEHGIDPGWETASAASERVALKLGYIPKDEYDWLILPK